MKTLKALALMATGALVTVVIRRATTNKLDVKELTSSYLAYSNNLSRLKRREHGRATDGEDEKQIELQRNVVKSIENCGLAIYKNAEKIAGNYPWQTGVVNISIDIHGERNSPIEAIKVQQEFLNILD